MQIRTKRLIITAFTQDNVNQVLESYALGKHILKYLDNLKKDPELLGWGVWYVSLAENNQVIGDIGFKGKPDNQGMVEVGYGIIPEMRNKGIATESVGAIIEWVFSSDRVKKVVAECLEDNVPSIKVLEKLGMRRTGSDNGMIIWELIKER
ncbi:GNAT family N-acetyltransferase [Paenibacillus glycanilyticus]|uniref:GNAT family N-acetyltransferase n=1 Tax=Paenibacillus glycanilyticus TaxID=126569 RepID=UPI00203FBFF8|nr:GNAT family N-acetyltransferase [Paenibacillus glycanilyticus]MCM3628164.1 GNAT family N-acetyltransferase [Paenibacillus glycanilyticus]